MNPLLPGVTLRLVCLDEQVGVDDRETRAFLDKEQMREAVIDLMIADRNDIGHQPVHELYCR